MTELRPPLDEHLSGPELLRWYWLRSELTAFARSLGVTTREGKQELTARLVAHLDHLTPPPPPRRPPQPSALPEPLTDATLIPAGQRCTQQLRRYLTAAIGPSFFFDAAMRDFITHGANRTLGDAAAHWYATRSHPAPEIGSQFELNRFVRAWHRRHPEASRAQALTAWRIHRGLPIEARPAIEDEMEVLGVVSRKRPLSTASTTAARNTRPRSGTATRPVPAKPATTALSRSPSAVPRLC